LTGIILEGLTRYYGQVKAVDGLNLTIAAGETVAVLGPNGAGKSTTIDMILGLRKPDSGQVTVFGRSPADAVKAGLISGMLQTGALIRETTVGELIEVMSSLYPDPMPAEEVMRITDTAAFAGRRTNNLSGGQAQRVRFALAIVANPELLVLDEPTVALDVEGRHEFWAVMRTFAERGKTVLFATHYLEEADQFADRVVLMAAGRVVADGTPGEIKARVGRRTIRATLHGADEKKLRALPGVADVEIRGGAVMLSSTDSDTALRAFLAAEPTAADIEVRGAGLDEAFMELTAPPATTP
jgi:ABC-2 type transport system ATP-binding protein